MIGRVYTIRPATRDDIAALARLKHAVAARAYEGQVPSAQLAQWLARSCGDSFFAWRIGRLDYHVLVAVDAAGEIVGVGGFRQRGTRADGSSVGLYVARPGMGIGAALLHAREQLALSLGCTRSRIGVWRTNVAAREFFEGRSFARTGTGYREATTAVMVDHYERDLIQQSAQVRTAA